MNLETAPVATGPRPPAVRRLLPPVRRRWWGDAVLGVVAAHLALVTALWVAADGVSDLGADAGDALTSLGRLAGLWASALLLLQVLGMARIPVVERAFGQDRVTAWHRWAGFTSFWLLVVHLGAVLTGYALLDGTNVVAETWNVVVTQPGMLLAALGTLMICVIAVTSFRAARRRPRYESWHLLHLYGYLGAGLVLPHQLWTGTSFAARPWSAVYWWTLWAVTAAAVLVYRVGVPVALNLRHRFRVAAVEPDGRGTVTVRITGEHLDRLRAEAGQFATFRFRTGPGWTRGHPLSLSGVPSTAGLRITVGLAGDDGARLAAVRPGTRVLMEGPYGRSTTSTRRARHVLGIAAGAGIAPIVGLLEDNAAVGGDTLVYRVSTDADAALTAQTAELTARAGLRYLLMAGRRGASGTSWLPERYAHIPGPAAVHDLLGGGSVDDHDVVVCGPGPWTRAVVADVRAAGVPSDHIHVDSYAW